MRKFLPTSRGFTLIELLVVVSIIAILSVIGITVFSGVQKNARDAKRRGDIDAISKAMEVHYGKFDVGKYPGLCANSPFPTYSYNCSNPDWFVDSSLPLDPQTAASVRYCWTASGTCNNSTGTALGPGQPPYNQNTWIICATLEAGGTYCKANQQ
ncbi:prepilin-type N-terminal cleavage/methylation domain-containing protein [Candidatus Daviesbacteria bacterium]|nr:prepilin-type N-terminal cleavage/methylation domain-containing protein [Candidatus Daviesbacteria bacterium]